MFENLFRAFTLPPKKHPSVRHFEARQFFGMVRNILGDVPCFYCKNHDTNDGLHVDWCNLHNDTIDDSLIQCFYEPNNETPAWKIKKPHLLEGYTPKDFTGWRKKMEVELANR